MERAKATRRPVLGLELRSGERSEPGRGGGPNTGGAPEGADNHPPVPNPEVLPKARRRTFTVQYKLAILQAVDAAKGTGEIGALLRREGLFSSHLTKWRAQQKAGALSGQTPRKRGPKPKPVNPLKARNAELERENRRLKRHLAKATMIIDIQKKVSELLGIPLDPTGSDEGTS